MYPEPPEVHLPENMKISENNKISKKTGHFVRNIESRRAEGIGWNIGNMDAILMDSWPQNLYLF